MHTSGFGHGSEKGVLVFAVAIFVGEDVGGGMRLVTSGAKGEADVAIILGNVIVEGFELIAIGGESLGEISGLAADGVVGDAAIALESGIPLRYLAPRFESSNTDVSNLVIVLLL